MSLKVKTINILSIFQYMLKTGPKLVIYVIPVAYSKR